MPPQDVQVPSTCRGLTDHAYIYVADDAWGTDVTQDQLETIAAAFEKATPSDPSQGIYSLDVSTFGEPPDVDGDPRVILFYVPMNAFQSFTFDGFFRADDQSPGPHSNETEMLHLNAAGKNAPDSEYMLGVVAHELVHLIASKYDSAEQGWLDEALAESAMVKAGYMTDLSAGKSYAKATAITPLCVSSYSDYGATFSWGSYMLDRFGSDFLASVLQDPADGRASIEAHLPSGTTFRDVFGEFMVATLLDQPGLGDGRYGFSSVDVSALGAEAAAVLDGAPHDVKSVAFGARMLKFSPSGAGTVSIDLSSADLAQLVVHSVAFDPASPDKATVTLEDATQSISVPVAAGQAVDLVIAVDAGPALSSSQSAPSSTITYTATYSP